MPWASVRVVLSARTRTPPRSKITMVGSLGWQVINSPAAVVAMPGWAQPTSADGDSGMRAQLSIHSNTWSPPPMRIGTRPTLRAVRRGMKALVCGTHGQVLCIDGQVRTCPHRVTVQLRVCQWTCAGRAVDLQESWEASTHLAAAGWRRRGLSWHELERAPRLL